MNLSPETLRQPSTDTGAIAPAVAGCVASSTMFFFSAFVLVLSWRLQAPVSATAPMQMLIRIPRFMYGCLLRSREQEVSQYKESMSVVAASPAATVVLLRPANPF